ncbi:hypothetical protein [Winogradskyella sp. SYSU M77433]|uniref:hypothetical protein n=1 Tax=Winogradskyella sp. SYSU M77433 TaxID=3042722 RepID=UPI0024811CEF|nr:hypothetical protein [Winogradskyella sp. SYSU M77433]MDH7913167.1 hypothetical protein [Winogradskyella sp. SYSU M77433]
MKKKFIKNYVINLCLFFVLFSCQEESIDKYKDVVQGRVLQRISLTDLNSKIGRSKDYSKLSKLFDVNRTLNDLQKNDTSSVPYLVTDEIIMIATNDMLYFTFVIENVTESNGYYNLVVAVNTSNTIESTRVLEYIPSDYWLQNTSQPFEGEVVIGNNDIFSSSDIATLFMAKTTGYCVSDVVADWECTSEVEVPNPPGVECETWDYFVTVYWEPCSTYIDQGNSGGGGSNGGSFFIGGSNGGTGNSSSNGNTNTDNDIVTSPFIQTQLDKLTSQTKDTKVKARIVQMQGDLDTANKEQGSEFRRIEGGIVAIGESRYTEHPVPEADLAFGETVFPDAVANTEVRVHLHHNNSRTNDNGEEEFLAPVFSLDDVTSMANFYKDKQNADSGLLNADAEDFNISSILVSERGLYAMRVVDVDKAEAFYQKIVFGPLVDGKTYRERLQDRYKKEVIGRVKKYCEQNSCDDALRELAFEVYFARFFASLDTGFALFHSLETDGNGNFIWDFLTN